MKALGSLLLASGLIGMSAPASAQDYHFEEWASLWQTTCGSLDAAFAVIDNPAAHGWSNADADSDEMAARIIETATISAKGTEGANLTGLFVLRQSTGETNALAAFQELQFVDQPESYLLACTLYDTTAPVMQVTDLARLSSERPFDDVSANGLTVIEWPNGGEESGRIKMTAGSIPPNHPAAPLLMSGLVLKTQYVFSETSE